jgi:DNA-binding PadR family transcriptional regulator
MSHQKSDCPGFEPGDQHGPPSGPMRGWHRYRGGHGPGGEAPWGGPMGFGGPVGPWGRHSPRAKRGDVRSAILTLLAEKPMHGYQIIQELGERTGGAWRPSPGSVYPTLQLLEDEGLVTATERDGKRVFEITEAGTAVLAEQPDGAPPWEQFSKGMDPEAARLMRSMRQAGAAAMQALSAGSPEQRARVSDALDEARKRIYGILAEDA